MTLFIIDRCRCIGTGFAELLALSKEQGLDLPAVQNATGAGLRCKHCRPWLKHAFATGESAFEEDSEHLRNGAIILQHFYPNRAAEQSD